MKKLLTALIGAALVASAVCGFAACSQKESDAVVLKALKDPAEVIANDDIDYFVVAEPMASARVKATAASESKLNFVGDLQKLYGGESGYPQAVAVAKNEVANSSAAAAFIGALKENPNWLANENTSIQTIVDAIAAHVTEGMQPALKAGNLTKQVIANCGIRFTEAAGDKEEVKLFLTALKGVQPDVVDSPADKFFRDSSAEPNGDVGGSLSVYAPDGAPALAIAGLMAGGVVPEGLNNEVNYNIVDASTIQTYVTGQSPKADICILPVNLAAKLLGTGDNYTMLGTVTHGNLYILSAKTGEEVTKQNISVLKGKTVGVVNLAAVPGLTFKLILNKFGLEYSDPAQA